MAIVRPEYIADLQKSQDLRFWRIYDSTNKVEMNRCLSDIGLEASIEMLQKDLENTSGDYVIVKLYSAKPERATNGSTVDSGIVRKVSLNPIMGKAHSSSSSFSPGFEFFFQMMEKQKSLELEMLEMRLAANQDNSILDKLLNNPMLQSFVAGQLMKSAPAPKISAPAPSSSESQSDRLAGILDRFSAIDPDYINTLERMAKKIEDRPDILPALKDSL